MDSQISGHGSSVVNRRTLPSWMKMNFDRLHTATDIEDYCSSPPETESGFHFAGGVQPFESIPDGSSTNASPLASPSAEDSRAALSLSSSANLRSVSSKITTSLPKIPSYIVLEEEGCSSLDSTPYGTPQASPRAARKVVADGSTALDENCMARNPKKWFYSGFFPPGTSPPVRKIPEGKEGVYAFTRPNKHAKNMDATREIKHPSHERGWKKYTVSNFDINAVGPTSW